MTASDTERQTSSARVAVRPPLYAWAVRRSGLDLDEVYSRFPQLESWEAGDRKPTIKQLQAFAKATHTPVGFFFLPEPPEEELPIPDYRTRGDSGVEEPGADLLDTIYDCEARQAWYRDYARTQGEGPLDFVGSLSLQTSVTDAAGELRRALDFELDGRTGTFTDAISTLSDHAEDLGVLVMINGVVGNNTHRKLDPDEFRGFALVDDVAPLVFVNGADTKAAQIFTLAHELAHVWLGESAVSDAIVATAPESGAERWCNEVAAEFLVPRDVFAQSLESGADLTEELDRLARRFKVSTLVVLRRMRDVGRFADADDYWRTYRAEVDRVLSLAAGGSGGGNFYNTQPVRTSKRFTRALLRSTIEGRTPETLAYRMLGFKKTATFRGLAESLGVA